LSAAAVPRLHATIVTIKVLISIIIMIINNNDNIVIYEKHNNDSNVTTPTIIIMITPRHSHFQVPGVQCNRMLDSSP